MIAMVFEPGRRMAYAAAASVLLLASVLAAPLAAQEMREAGGWAATDFSRVRLIAAVEAVGTGETVRAGFHVQLSDGWHFYWRSPGETGFPPVFDWDASHNVSGVDIYWPAPDRLNLLGFVTYGYSREVLLPLSVAVSEPGNPVDLRVRANFAICSDEICTYHDETFAVRLPAGAALPAPHAGLIEDFAKRVPQSGASDLRIVDAVAAAQGEERVIAVRALSAVGFSAPDLIVEGPADFFFGPPRTELGDGGHAARLILPVTGDGAALAGLAVTLTLIDGSRAVERVVVIGGP